MKHCYLLLLGLLLILLIAGFIFAIVKLSQYVSGLF